MKIFVPRDAAAKALGADEVADAITAEAAARGLDITLVRNGTRGMVWLEPLVEVETSAGRTAFGPVTASDVKSLFEAEFHRHPLALGAVETIPFFARQTRLADPAQPHDRDQAHVGVGQPATQPRQVTLAADQRRGWRGNGMRGAFR